MKKLTAGILTLVSSGMLFALPTGNPAQPALICREVLWEFLDCFCHGYRPFHGCVSAHVGLWGDYVFNNHMEAHRDTGSDIERTSTFTNAGYLGLNLFNRMELYATFGATSISLSTNAAAFNGTDGQRFTLETTTDFSWSVGFSTVIWECDCTTFGFDVQYFTTHPDVRRVSIADTNSVYPGSHFDAKYWEWQMSVGVAHQIGCLTPYFAARGGRASINFDRARTADFELVPLASKFNGGYTLGVTWAFCQAATITVEGRWPDQKALHVNGMLHW